MNFRDEFDEIVDDPNYVGKFRSKTSQTGVMANISKKPLDGLFYKLGALGLILGIGLFGVSQIVIKNHNAEKKAAQQQTAPVAKAPKIDKSTSIAIFNIGLPGGVAAINASQTLTNNGYTVSYAGDYPASPIIPPAGVYYTDVKFLAPAQDIANTLGIPAVQTQDFPRPITVVVAQ
ncbi:MAG: LytR C-terminal domain-containing protein [Micrococcaceae bacterium]